MDDYKIIDITQVIFWKNGIDTMISKLHLRKGKVFYVYNLSKDMEQ